MANADAKELTIAVDATRRVSALLRAPADARACYVLAHGAGAGMRHPFTGAITEALASRAIATLRYQFPYMEQGSKRPDVPALARATVRAAIAEAARAMPGVALVAGGKSFGGRMTSQAQAAAPLPDVRGLAFLGFPLHPAGKPSDERATHLADVHVPMLFLQGTRDDLASLSLLKPVVERLGSNAKLVLFDDADHSFHVPARSGRNDADVLAALADAIAAWLGELVPSRA
jgi:uncharacterized protein